jgi:hypothetical protein
MDEHGIMFFLLSARAASGASEKKTSKRFSQRLGQLDWNVIFFMLWRKGRCIILNPFDDRKPFLCWNTGINIAIESKNFGRADIIGWRLDVDDEAARKNIITVLLRLYWVRDLTSWRSCISFNVTLFRSIGIR